LAWVCCLWFCRMPYWLEKSANLWFYLLAYYLRKLPIRFYLEPIGWKMPPMILTAWLPLSHTGCLRFRALRNLDTLSYICYAKTVRALAFMPPMCLVHSWYIWELLFCSNLLQYLWFRECYHPVLPSFIFSFGVMESLFKGIFFNVWSWLPRIGQSSLHISLPVGGLWFLPFIITAHEEPGPSSISADHTANITWVSVSWPTRWPSQPIRNQVVPNVQNIMHSMLSDE